MDKDTRGAIRGATERVRAILESDFAEQLLGDYDVMQDGRVEDRPGAHLTGDQRALRLRIVAAIEHKRAQGMKPNEAVADYLRDAAFTTLNRFVALKMLEARDLVQECVSKGEASSGFVNEFCGLAPGLKFPDGSGYRLYVESIFDELSTEVKVLFDRRDPASALWPRKAAFDEMLASLNSSELKGVWGDDETIGWVYQYFNGQEERRRMREQSSAPRNSRELAVRNQFFTPRYVVQFLTDNTLGRIWYEMRGTDTELANRCEFMVRRPGEDFAPRAKKDPRDLRILDPACGSGHFLLYAFDLLLTIYEEAFVDNVSPKSQATGRSLAEDYPSIEALRKAVPGLILAHNLHGVDIDPRCAQIAQLALWMRAQRAFGESGVDRGARPQIRRANIVIAEPMPGEKDLLRDFLATLKEDRLGDLIRRALDIPANRNVHPTKEMAESLAELVSTVWDRMKLAGEMGTLLRIERDIASAIKKGRTEWDDSLPLFRLTQYGLGGPVSEKFVKVAPGEDEDFWGKAEKLVFRALADYVEGSGASGNVRRRLFVEDAAQGFGLVDLVSKKFDTVLMNPPFGNPCVQGASEAEIAYEGIKHDISVAFIARASELCPSGYCGAITTRTPFYLAYLASWRINSFVESRTQILFVDFGLGVLDAMVETSCVCWDYGQQAEDSTFVRLLGVEDKPTTLAKEVYQINYGLPSRRVFKRSTSSFGGLPKAPFVYNAPDAAFAIFEHGEPLRHHSRDLFVGAATQDDFRFTRLRWELDQTRLEAWPTYANGGHYHPILVDVPVRIKWDDNGRELKAFLAAYRKGKGFSEHWTAVLNSHNKYFSPGITWSRRPYRLGSFWALPQQSIFGNTGLALLDNERDLSFDLGVMNSSTFLSLLSFFMPRGSEGEGQTLKYELGYVAAVPFPRASSDAARSISAIVHEIGDALAQVICLDERSALWLCVRGDTPAAVELSQTLIDLPTRIAQVTEDVRALQARLDDEIIEIYADTAQIHSDAVVALAQEIGPIRDNLQHDVLTTCSTSDAERRLVSYIVGIAFGRWRQDTSGVRPEIADWLVPHQRQGDLMSPEIACDTYVDDEGDPADLANSVRSIVDDGVVCSLLEKQLLRKWLRAGFFDWHIQEYSETRRKAPIYWQLATPSASYSVWLYIHAFTKDTLFRVQNDYVAPKLAHEERRLESLKSEVGDGGTGTTAQRKETAAQQSFVDEVRSFLEEVKRVAPLWDPNLDDGVIINFAPLWRLVPQHKAWQKELKATWDSLCDAEYDWSSLAMHLWPERVVPKCATDRSLAIAHGLEEVFWFEGDDGKWKARKTPTRPTSELIAERSSEAVKAALKSLLEASEPSGPAKRGRKSKAA